MPVQATRPVRTEVTPTAAPSEPPLLEPEPAAPSDSSLERGAASEPPEAGALQAAPEAPAEPAEDVELGEPSAGAPAPAPPPPDVPARPLLASEALIEDLAPWEPARSAARWWCAALGLGFLALGGLAAFGLRPGGAQTAVPSLFLGAIAFVAGVARVAYWRRALAMVVLGLLAAGLGLRGAGPAMDLGLGGAALGFVRMAAATTLAAALLFRSRYRAYGGARRALAGAFFVALPYTGYLVYRLVTGGADVATLGSGLALASVLTALTGFMGAETTGAGAYTAFAVVAALSAELALEALAGGVAFTTVHVLEIVSASLAFAVTAGIASLGCFQLLAWRFAADARRIDLHAHRTEPGSAPPPSSDDWAGPS
jgi:hypothetical protein